MVTASAVRPQLQAEAEKIIGDARAAAQKKVADAKAAVSAECAAELAAAKSVRTRAFKWGSSLGVTLGIQRMRDCRVGTECGGEHAVLERVGRVG